jgi:hypothetical protein
MASQILSKITHTLAKNGLQNSLKVTHTLNRKSAVFAIENFAENSSSSALYGLKKTFLKISSFSPLYGQN